VPRLLHHRICEKLHHLHCHLSKGRANHAYNRHKTKQLRTREIIPRRASLQPLEPFATPTESPESPKPSAKTPKLSEKEKKLTFHEAVVEKEKKLTFPAALLMPQGSDCIRGILLHES
jgi:hypothetical protein